MITYYLVESSVWFAVWYRDC